jgi:hypothetical protein
MGLFATLTTISSAVMLSVILLSIIILNVEMLSVIMPIVVAPKKYYNLDIWKMLIRIIKNVSFYTDY